MEGERAVAATFARIYAQTHKDVLAAVHGLSDGQLRARTPRSNSIAFDLWHIARWADHLASILGTMTPGLRERIGPTQEVWTEQSLARRWGLDTQHLAQAATGMGMDEEVSAELTLPPTEELLTYAKHAFALVERAVAAIEDGDLNAAAEIAPERVPWLNGSSAQGTVASWLLTSLRHECRHLGMIEALKGAAGVRGTATV